VQTRALPVEQFAALEALPEISHAFTTRVAGVDVSYDKAVALQQLDRVHREIREELGVGSMPFVTADQVHGNRVEVVRAPLADLCISQCDGLITNEREICLGIYVADCCAVYLVDPVRKVIGLLHSGRKGSELGIAEKGIRAMTDHFSTDARDLIVQLSPCIRPPHYEIDFAAQIVAQCRSLGVTKIADSGTCTVCDLSRYYSYRAEKGRTGRMLALLTIV
jgi:copper oxidase (laccase) domain-containing protein